MTEQIVKKIERLLAQANFETMAFGELAKFCFDILVKKDQRVMMIKVFNNIDNLNEDVLNSIKTLSALLKSRPILVGSKNRYGPLEDETIYMREDLPFFSYNTFERIMKSNLYPYILARRGGGVVFLDGDKMKTLREEKNLSRKIVSDEIGVCKRTVCAYENEKMRPSQEIADSDKSIIRKINVLEWNVKFTIDQEELFQGEELNDLESHLKNIMDDIGISSFWHKRGQLPFKLTLFPQAFDFDAKDQFYPLLSAVSEKKNRLQELNLKCLRMFTQLFQKHGMIVVNDNFKISDNIQKIPIPFIKIKKLEKVDDEREFINLIRKKE